MGELWEKQTQGLTSVPRRAETQLDRLQGRHLATPSCPLSQAGRVSYSLPWEGVKNQTKHQACLFTHNSSEGTFCLTAKLGPGAPRSLDLFTD